MFHRNLNRSWLHAISTVVRFQKLRLTSTNHRTKRALVRFQEIWQSNQESQLEDLIDRETLWIKIKITENMNWRWRNVKQLAMPRHLNIKTLKWAASWITKATLQFTQNLNLIRVDSEQQKLKVQWSLKQTADNNPSRTSIWKTSQRSQRKSDWN